MKKKSTKITQKQLDKVRGNNFFCDRCNMSSVTEDIMIDHKERQHGMYGEKKHKGSKGDKLIKRLYFDCINETHNINVIEPEYKWMFMQLPIMGTDKFLDVDFKWDEKDKTFKMYTSQTIHGQDLEINFSKKRGYYIITPIDEVRRLEKARYIRMENIKIKKQQINEKIKLGNIKLGGK